MTIAQIEAGTLVANREDRTVTGLLLKFGEIGRTNLGRFKVTKGAFKLPQDVKSFLNLHDTHNRPVKSIGSALFAQETDDGILAAWRINDGPEGDALLAKWESGDPDVPRKLSIEVDGVTIKNGVATSGIVHGAALVPSGGFPSSTLLAADTPDEVDESTGKEPVETTETFSDEFTDENGVTQKRTTTRTTRVEVDADGTEKTTITEKTVIEAPETPAPEQEEEPVGVPNTLTAAKAGGTTITTEERPVDARTVFAAIAAEKAHSATHEQSTLLAALADIKISGTGSLPAAGVLQNNWVGQVWQGKEYSRKFINLLKLGTDISAEGKKGFKINRGTTASPKTILGGDWAGNKVEVPTGGGFTSTITSNLDRFAWAGDFAREFWDLPGGAPVVEAFMRLIVEDYAVWSDEKALAYVRSSVTALTPPAAPPTGYPTAMARLIQGYRAITKAKDTPSFAIVNSAAMDQLIFTPHEQIPEFVSMAVSIEGTATVDGKLAVVEAPDSFFTGVLNTAPAVIVGAQNAIEFDELSSTPLQIDALEIARGGIDRAVHGYLQKFLVRPESLVLVGQPSA